MQLLKAITSKLPFLSKLSNKLFIFSKTNLVILLVILGLILIWLWHSPFASNLQMLGYKPFTQLLNKIIITISYVVVLISVIGIWLFKLFKKNAEQKEEKQDTTEKPNDDITNQQKYLENFALHLQQRFKAKNFQYKLPWYLVIGDKDSGKSSLLRESCKLNDLCAANDEQHVKCYLGDQAVIIDIKGDLFNSTNTSNEQQLWFNLLDWCKEKRALQPINGIILTVDIYQLSAFDKQEKETYLSNLINRLRNIIQTLHTKIPIYIVLTKMDLLYGFHATYGSLDQKMRDEIMGITFKLNSNELRNELKHFWQQLFSRLNLQLPTLLLNNADKRSQLFSFVRQINCIKDHVVQLVDGILNVIAKDDLIIRGVYLTSAMGQGQMDDLFVTGVAEQYNLPKQIYPSHQIQYSRSYFVHNLFTTLLFKEPHLASKNAEYQRLNKKKLYVYGVLSVSTVLIMLSGMHYYFLQNYNASIKTLDKVSEYVAILATKQEHDVNNDDMQLKLLNPLLDALMAYGNYQSRLAVIAGMGLDQGHKIVPIVANVYLKILQQHFLPSVMKLLQQELDNSEPGSEQKLHILRIMRMVEDETMRDKNMIISYMMEYWSKSFTGQEDMQNKLQQHLSYALDHIKWKKARDEHNKLAIESYLPFKSSIEKAQLELSSRPIYHRVYQNIRDKSKKVLINDLNIKQHIGGGFDAVFAVKSDKTLEIAQLFTRLGLSGYFVNQYSKFIDLAAIDNWSLNITSAVNYSENDKQEIERQIINLYINDYISTWDLAYSSIHIKQLHDIAEAIKALEQIIGSEQVFKKTITLLKENTSIPEIPKIEGVSANANTAINLIASNLPDQQLLTQLNRKFKQDTNIVLDTDEGISPLHNVNMQLGELHRYLLAIYSAPDPGKAALKAVQLHIMNNDSNPIFELKQSAKSQPPIYGRWLRELCAEVWRTVVLQALDSLEKQWTDTVVSQYKMSFENRYPFKEDAKQMVPLSEFERFFGYDGILANFYQQNLKIFIENNLDVADSDKKLIRRDILKQLEQAEKIRRTYFSKQNGLGISFSIQPIAMSGNVRSGILNLDGQFIEYKHTRHKAVNLIWPNSMGSNIQSKLNLNGKDLRAKTLTYEGAWGLIKLINSGKLTNVNKDSFDVRFDLNGSYITYRIFIDEADNPFTGGLFNQFSLPDTLY